MFRNAIRALSFSLCVGVTILFSVPASATTLYILYVREDKSAVWVIEPEQISSPLPGHKRTQIISISVFNLVDITDIELDCTDHKSNVISEKLYNSDGQFQVDKTHLIDKGWVSFASNSDVFGVVCNWPQSKVPNAEVNGPNYWQLVKTLYSSLELPDYDDE